MERRRSDKVPCVACGLATVGRINNILPQSWNELYGYLLQVPLCPRCQLLSGTLSDPQILEHFDIAQHELTEQKWQILDAVRTWCIQSRKLKEAKASMPRLRNVNRPTSQRLKEKWQNLRQYVRNLKQPPATKVAPVKPEWRILRLRAGCVWTEAEDTQLRNEVMAGFSVEQIASHLGRGTFSVEVRAVKLGL